jgi:hypothetical protein
MDALGNRILGVFILGSPSLTHQFHQMLQGFFIAAFFRIRELARALIELRRHFGRFSFRTPQSDQDGRQFVESHASGVETLKPGAQKPQLFARFPTICSYAFVRQGLFDRVSCNDLDAFDAHALVGTIGRMGWRRGNFLQNIIAFNQFSEGGILMIKETRGSVTDEELAPG